MTYSVLKPSALLAPYVKQYWHMQTEIIDVVHKQRIVPCGLHELIFYLNGNPKGNPNESSENDTMTLTGQLSNSYDISITGKITIFAVYFYPHALQSFLDFPSNEFQNKSIPVKYVFKDHVNYLQDKLCAVDEVRELVKIVEGFLISMLHKKFNAQLFKRIKPTIDQINLARGIVDINQLASDSCLSRKQYERVFKESVGTSPKQFLKTVRFQNAIHQKSSAPDLSLTQLAYKCGYYDQAHMVNDFKSMSGLTPKQYFSDCPVFSDYFYSS